MGISGLSNGWGLSSDFNQSASDLAPVKDGAPKAPAVEAQTTTKVTAPTFDFSKKKKDGAA